MRPFELKRKGIPTTPLTVQPAQIVEHPVNRLVPAVPVALKRVNLAGRCGQSELAALDLLKKVRHPHLLAMHACWVEGELLIVAWSWPRKACDRS